MSNTTQILAKLSDFTSAKRFGLKEINVHPQRQVKNVSLVPIYNTSLTGTNQDTPVGYMIWRGYLMPKFSPADPTNNKPASYFSESGTLWEKTDSIGYTIFFKEIVYAQPGNDTTTNISEIGWDIECRQTNDFSYAKCIINYDNSTGLRTLKYYNYNNNDLANPDLIQYYNINDRFKLKTLLVHPDNGENDAQEILTNYYVELSGAELPQAEKEKVSKFIGASFLS